jgi:hypothetical protein
MSLPVAKLTRLSFISRGLLVKKFGLDDFFIGVAVVSKGQRVWSLSANQERFLEAFKRRPFLCKLHMELDDIRRNYICMASMRC